MKKCFLKMITTILACALIFLSSSNILAATPTRAESDYLSNQSLYYAHEALNLEISNPQSSYYCCEPSAIEYGNPIPAYYYSNNIYEEENYSYFRSIYFTNDQVYPYSLGTRSGYIDEFILVS